MVLLVILCCRMLYSIHYNLTMLFNVAAVRWMWMLFVSQEKTFPLLVIFLFPVLPGFLASCHVQMLFGIPEEVGIHRWLRILPETHVFWWRHHPDGLSLHYRILCDCSFEAFLIFGAWSWTRLQWPILSMWLFSINQSFVCRCVCVCGLWSRMHQWQALFSFKTDERPRGRTLFTWNNKS